MNTHQRPTMARILNTVVGWVGPATSHLTTNRFTIPTIMAVAILGGNATYLFVDTLWHDDSQWYFRATEGTVLELEWRGKVTVLSPYLDVLYAHGMATLGVPFTRGLFVIVMGIGSFLLYLLYSRTFGIDRHLSAAAAIVPNVLPSLKGIPVGLNASYAMWGLAPLVACLLLLSKALTTSGQRSLTAATAAAAWYYLGLNLPGQPSSNLLIPNVLFFFVFFIRQNARRTVLYALPFVAYGMWSLYKQYAFGHRSPQLLPVETILSRTNEFLEMASFLPFNAPYSLPVTGVLMLLGFVAIAASKHAIAKPSTIAWSPGIHRLILFAWLGVWLVCNSVPYTTASMQFRPYDYAYIFNFAAVLLQVVGLGSLALGCCRVLNARGTGHSLTLVVLAACTIWVTVQRISYTYHPWGWKKHYANISSELRRGLSDRYLPFGSQVLIFGDYAGVGRLGQIESNSGYIRYLTNRDDLYALIGNDDFPANVFAPWSGWFTPMRGLNQDRPVVALRRDSVGSLRRLDYLLAVEPNADPSLPRLRWRLYSISSNSEAARQVSEGVGLESYGDAVSDLLPGVEDPSGYVAFAPTSAHDEFLTEKSAAEVATSEALAQDLSIGNHLFLRSVLVDQDAKAAPPQLKILLKIVEKPKGSFRLAYRINGTTYRVSLWNYARAGDNLLITTPRIQPVPGRSSFNLEFLDAGSFPHRPLPIHSDGHDGTQVLLQLPD